MLATDSKLPVVGGAEKRQYVRGIFTAIAPRYDFLNHLLSLNIDKYWRRKAVQQLGWQRRPDGRYLDLCAGTLDLAAALATRAGFRGQVLGADFVKPMLERGRGKSNRVWAVNADALELPLPSASVDGATVGFGVRNLADLDAGLTEAARVLRPGARLVILEFSTPPKQPIRGLYFFYFRHVLPTIGRLVSKHTSAYTYLPESVLAFPGPEELSARMSVRGFTDVSFQLMLGGICAIHVGTRA
ncbi:MAG: bifunctional demethylmenaquinone methyltransferase/2-methoxy-6-polyprenyl-1,4-benzoquinol methylase UbiE [Gemmatimonadota bacterium]